MSAIDLDQLARHGSVDISHLISGQENLAAPLQPEFDTTLSAAHEARHLSAVMMLGAGTPVLATAQPDLKAGYGGIVRTIGDKSWADLNWDDLRQEALVLVVGDIGDRPGWPPKDLPKIIDAKSQDEWQLRVILERLGTTPDKRQQAWSAIRLEALAMVENPVFAELQRRYETMLLAGETLGWLSITETYDEVTKSLEERPPEPAAYTIDDQIADTYRLLKAVENASDIKPAPWRDVLEVERSAGLITDEEAQGRIAAHDDMHDLMVRMLNSRDPDELRKRAEVIAAKYPDKPKSKSRRGVKPSRRQWARR